MITVGQALHHLGGGLLAAEIEEKLLDILDFERPLLERVLSQEIFHGHLS
jgi:hypothetical protein